MMTIWVFTKIVLLQIFWDIKNSDNIIRVQTKIYLQLRTLMMNIYWHCCQYFDIRISSCLLLINTTTKYGYRIIRTFIYRIHF